MSVSRIARTLVLVALSGGLLSSIACHPGAVIDPGPKQQVGGTIAGIVLSETKTAVTGRKVTAIETQTGQRYEATTGLNGGYTIKVPRGNYRIDVELQAGESIAKRPPETKINTSDLDP